MFSDPILLTGATLDVMQTAGLRGILHSPDPASERGNGTETIDIITAAAGMTYMGVTTIAVAAAGTSGMTTATEAPETAMAAEMGAMRNGVAGTAIAAVTAIGGTTGG